MSSVTPVSAVVAAGAGLPAVCRLKTDVLVVTANARRAPTPISDRYRFS
jgi:hypothetical protein